MARAPPNYIYNAKRYATQARRYGASVYEIYSPHATWARVKAAAQGANVLIYLGHGNGYPSPYGAFSAYTKDGLGLNATSGRQLQQQVLRRVLHRPTYIKLAPNAVVILNRLCYASGNNEWGAGQPDEGGRDQARSTTTGRASCGPARGPCSPGHHQRVVHPVQPVQDEPDDRADLLRPSLERACDFKFPSRRNPRFRGHGSVAPSRYYRSVIGNLGLTAATIRGS